MKKKVNAVIDDAAKCPYFEYKQLGGFEKILSVRNSPKCYHPAVSKPGYIRKCNCAFDKVTGKYSIKDGCPLESVIDEDTVKAVLQQLKYAESAEAAETEIDAAAEEQDPAGMEATK